MSRRPHVCFVIPHGAQLFFPQVAHRHGGAEVQLALLARELTEAGDFRVTVVMGAFGQPRYAMVDDVQCLAYRYGGAWGAFDLHCQLLRAAAQVYVQRAMGSTTRQVSAFCHFWGRKFVYWMAADLDARAPLHLGADAQAAAPTRTQAFERALRRADRIIAQHVRQQRLLREHTGLEAIVIPNGLPPRPLPTVPRTHHLWVGHCNALKNPLPVLALARALPAEPFLMVVPREGADAAMLAELEAGAAVLPNVELRTRVPFGEMDALFDAARSYLMTSVAEGFPNTVLQACWSGTPTLSLHINLQELLGDDYPLADAGGDVERMAAQLAELIARPDGEELSAWLHLRARQRFSAENVALQLAVVLRGFFPRGTRRGPGWGQPGPRPRAIP